MTLIGIVFFILALLFYYKDIKWLLGLFCISVTFMAASFLILGEKGVPLYMVCEFFIILKTLPYIFNNNLKLKRYEFSLLFFIFISFVILFFSPKIFFDITVSLDPTQDNYNGGKPYVSISNYFQIFYIIFHFLALYGVRNYTKYNNSIDFSNIILNSSLVTLVYGFLFYFSKIKGFYSLFIPIFYNNPGQEQAAGSFDFLRYQAGFPEASYCGAYLGSLFWLAIYSKRYFLSLIIFLALVLTISGTGLTAFISGLIIFIIYKFKNIGNARNIFILWIVFTVFIVLDSYFNIFDLVYNFINNKNDSHSGDVRSSQVFLALSIIKDTYLMGVGINVTRGGGFLINLIACTGVLGLISFIYFLCKMIVGKSVEKEYVFFSALFVAIIVAVPDLSFPFLWASFIIFVASRKMNRSKF